MNVYYRKLKDIDGENNHQEYTKIKAMNVPSAYQMDHL